MVDGVVYSVDGSECSYGNSQGDVPCYGRGVLGYDWYLCRLSFCFCFQK